MTVTVWRYFLQFADVQGLSAYTIPASKSIDVSVGYQHTKYDVKAGHAQLNYVDGVSPISKFKDVQFNSYTVKASISIRF